jgi:hypothetical protein
MGDEMRKAFEAGYKGSLPNLTEDEELERHANQHAEKALHVLFSHVYQGYWEKAQQTLNALDAVTRSELQDKTIELINNA